MLNPRIMYKYRVVRQLCWQRGVRAAERLGRRAGVRRCAGCSYRSGGAHKLWGYNRHNLHPSERERVLTSGLCKPHCTYERHTHIFLACPS